jgi:hypothetical protein
MQECNPPRNSWLQTHQDDVLLFRQWNQAGFAAFLEPVALAADVHRGGMMQQAIEDCCGDDRVR